MSGSLLPIMSTLAGAGIALLGQYAAQRTSQKQHDEQLEQRSTELLSSFALPIATRRAEALEQLFSLVQEVLDDRQLSLGNYEKVRRLLIYAPAPLAQELVETLATFMQGHRTGDAARIEASADQLKGLQQKLRVTAGLGSLDAYVEELNQLKAEAIASE